MQEQHSNKFNFEAALSDPRSVGVQFEAKLSEWNIAAEYVEALPIADLIVADWAQVRNNEHRLHNQQVEEYAEQMRNGAIFPPVVVMPVGSETVIIDGNTRFHAAKKARLKTIPAFRAAFPAADVAKAFAGTMNQRNGRRLHPEEAQKVAEILRGRAHTEESIALELGYSRAQIINWRKEADFTRHAAAVGLDERIVAAIPKPNRRRLADITLDSTFAEAAKYAAEYRPESRDLKALTEEIKTAPSEVAATNIVHAAKKQAAVAGPPPHRVTVPTAIRRIRSLFPQMLALLEHPEQLLELDAEHRSTTREQAKALIEGLTRVIEINQDLSNE